MKLRSIIAMSMGLLCAGAAIADTTTPTTTPAAQPTTAKTTTISAPATTPAINSNIAALPTEQDKISYSIGVDLGTNFKMQSIDISSAAFMRGMQDGLNNNKTLLTKEQMIETLTNFKKQLMAKREAEFNASSTKNQQEGTAFLTSNKTKPGIMTTASGLQYKIVQQGQGAAPSDNDIVTVEYTGKDIQGKVFDSSEQHGKQVTFPVSQVIPGWTEALKLMKPGSTYEIYVPSTLAYGTHGMPPVIGPNQTLLFTIHLVSIKPQPTASSPASAAMPISATAATTTSSSSTKK